MYDLIIIGGGPAGITAGIYAARQRLNTLLITKSFGGQVARKTVAIENYPGFEKISGIELVQKFENHLKKFSHQDLLKEGLNGQIDVKKDSVVKARKQGNNFLILTANKKKFQAKTVIVASGADPLSLGIPGEKKFIGRGISYCTACDAPFFEDKTVAVIGGGNAGFEAAIALSKWAKKVYILEYSSKIGADEINQRRIKDTEKVQIVISAALKKIKGNKFVDSIEYQDRKTKKNEVLSVEGVFVEIGSQPATSFLENLVDFNKINEIKVDFETCQTKTPGLFAAGDVNVGPFKQIVTACGEGAKAALAAYNYLIRYGK